MKNHIKGIGAVLRKDVLLLWPMAVLSLLLMLLYVVLVELRPVPVPPVVLSLMATIAYVAIALVMASAIQGDTPASTRHDWITRAVSRADLVIAKAVFVAVLGLVPLTIGRAIIAARDGASWIEIVLYATTVDLAMITTIAAFCAIAVLTSSLLQGIALVVAVIAAITLLTPITLGISGVGEEIFGSGSGWLVMYPRAWFALIAAALIIWLMYWPRRIVLARVVFALAAMLLIASPILSPWSVVFSMQKGLSPDPAAAEPVTLTPRKVCFPTIRVNPPSDTGIDPQLSAAPEADLSPELWAGERRRAAGSQAIGFETSVATGGVPEGWRLSIGRVEAAYVAAQDARALEIVPARHTAAWRTSPDGGRSASHFWLLSGRAYDRLQESPVRLRLDYSLTLMSPSRTAEIVVDGEDRYVQGFGHCSARYDAQVASIKVDCFKRGAQPAQMTARLVGASPHSEIPSDFPNYMPAILEPLDGKRHEMILRGVKKESSARVKLTSFEARAHFDRRVMFEGVLGGSSDQCPPPPSTS